MGLPSPDPRLRAEVVSRHRKARHPEISAAKLRRMARDRVPYPGAFVKTHAAKAKLRQAKARKFGHSPCQASVTKRLRD